MMVVTATMSVKSISKKVGFKKYLKSGETRCIFKLIKQSVPKSRSATTKRHSHPLFSACYGAGTA